MTFLDMFKTKQAINSITFAEPSLPVDIESVVYDSGMIIPHNFGDINSQAMGKVVSANEFARYTINLLTDQYPHLFKDITIKSLELKPRYTLELDLYTAGEVGNKLTARIFNIHNLEQYSETIWARRESADRLYPEKIFSFRRSQMIFPTEDQHTAFEVTAMCYRIMTTSNRNKPSLIFN
jgi:hypothetical protein